MASLGQELKRERELRGITLKEISESTRISLKFLQALEDDRLEVIPGQFYTQAILRAYARTAGLDENQWLNKYREILLFEQYALDKHPHKKLSPPLILTKRRLVALLIVLGLAAAGALAYFVFVSFQGQSRIPPPQPKPRAAAPSLPPPLTEAQVEPSAAEESEGLDLKISFLAETWLQVFADGKLVWDGIKVPGETLEVRADLDVVFNLGNAGGLDVTINGRRARPLGPAGAVRKDIRITLENYREYLLPEEENKG
jgi:cytoskeleton protein RodZ